MEYMDRLDSVENEKRRKQLEEELKDIRGVINA